VLAHRYFRIEPVWLWDAVTAALAPLRAAVVAELQREADRDGMAP
jgi:uncharacterized protein with HEPN domain